MFTFSSMAPRPEKDMPNRRTLLMGFSGIAQDDWSSCAARRFSTYKAWDFPREADSGATRFLVRTVRSHNKSIRLASVNRLEGRPGYGHDSNTVGGLHPLEFVVLVV